MKERISTLSYCMYLQKKSFLTAPINELLEDISANGLIVKLYKKYFNTNALKPKYLALEQNQLKPITMMEIMGTFQICGILYLIAVIVFFVELIVFRLNLYFHAS